MRSRVIHSVLFCFIFCVHCSSQPGELIKSIDARLSKNEITISKVLTDTAFMFLHSLTPFREIIKQHAKAEKIKLNCDKEPGTKITVKANVSDRAGNPLVNKLVYVYQTSSEGWYSDTAPHILKNEGDRKHARLFGYFKTDATGKFEFTTIKPKGYPNSSLPAHIHIEIALTDDQYFISELLFDDDPRLVGEIRARSINEQFYIVKNTGSERDPVYSYTIRVMR